MTSAEKTHSTMKRVAGDLDGLRRKYRFNQFPNTMWHEAIAKTSESGLTVGQQTLLLVSWAQRQGIPKSDTPIYELVEAFDRTPKRKADSKRIRFE